MISRPFLRLAPGYGGAARHETIPRGGGGFRGAEADPTGGIRGRSGDRQATGRVWTWSRVRWGKVDQETEEVEEVNLGKGFSSVFFGALHNRSPGEE